jgi:hypothetical protein
MSASTDRDEIADVLAATVDDELASERTVVRRPDPTAGGSHGSANSRAMRAVDAAARS